jgi:NADH:ubiquinone oxidoreductase subunit 3 (subunit A)
MNTLTFFFFFVCILVLALLLLNKLVSVNKPYAEKVSPYECGYSPVGDTRGKFSIQFYLVAILFLIFDLEAILLFPFAVTLYQVSTYGFWIIFFFLIILTVGLVYELSVGALKFHQNPSNNGPKTPPNHPTSKSKRTARSAPKRS